MKTIKMITATSILALTPASLLPLPTHPAHADTINAGDKYVALGDSYASTGTLAQQVPGTHPACVQDQDNYPHQLAQNSTSTSTTPPAPGHSPTNTTNHKTTPYQAQHPPHKKNTSLRTLNSSPSASAATMPD